MKNAMAQTVTFRYVQEEKEETLYIREKKKETPHGKVKETASSTTRVGEGGQAGSSGAECQRPA